MLNPTQQGSAVVRNAADAAQVKRARRLEKRRQQRLADAIRGVMSTPTGRLFVWELLAACQIYGSAYDNSGSRTYFNIGRQDVGKELLADLHLVDTELFLLMEREMRALAKRDQSEIEAGHTKAATEDDEEQDTNG